jgi:phosphoglycolate phosphatase-like HAD superfamily hydrolase
MQLGINDLFAQVHVVQPVQASEQKAVRLKLIAAQCFIGDTESDFHAARAAEVPFYAVTTGQRNESYLRSQGMTQLFSTLQDAMIKMQ